MEHVALEEFWKGKKSKRTPDGGPFWFLALPTFLWACSFFPTTLILINSQFVLPKFQFISNSLVVFVLNFLERPESFDFTFYHFVIIWLFWWCLIVFIKNWNKLIFLFFYMHSTVFKKSPMLPGFQLTSYDYVWFRCFVKKSG